MYIVSFNSAEMERFLSKELVAWKASKYRKPLIIQGARQVGKTWLMREFGKKAFKNVVYLNFESSSRLKELFVMDYDIQRIITIIEIETQEKIDIEHTLLIFDEIQEAEKGLTALKYFYEKAPGYFILAAGSLLGTSMQKKHAFPVGKVDFLQLNPLSFMEFLSSIGESALADQITQQQWNVVSAFHEKLIAYLRLYYFIGGMPEAVAHYIENKDLTAVREIQEMILIGYENDFAKYAPNDIVPRIKMVWHSILTQLSKENRKYIYGQIKKGARAKDFETAINWLSDAGLIVKINRVESGKLPLSAYLEMDDFKLFLLDVGLLNAKGNLDPTIILEKNKILVEFKGAFTEQYVCQQLVVKRPNQVYYWSAEKASAEIDFVLQEKNAVLPIEVKAEENLKAKSLKVFVEKYQTGKAIRTSMSPYREEDWLINVPLYALESLF